MPNTKARSDMTGGSDAATTHAATVAIPKAYEKPNAGTAHAGKRAPSTPALDKLPEGSVTTSSSVTYAANSLSPEAASFHPEHQYSGSTNSGKAGSPTKAPVIVNSFIPAELFKNGMTDVEATRIVYNARGDIVSTSEETLHFTTDMIQGSHYIKIGGIAKDKFNAAADNFSNTFDWEGKLRGQHMPPRNGKLLEYFACFDDVRDAVTAAKVVKKLYPELQFEFLNQPEYATVTTPSNNAQVHGVETTKYHDGQVMFAAKFKGYGTLHSFLSSGLDDFIQDLAGQFGDVMAFRQEASSEKALLKYRVEFYKVSAAKQILKHVTEATPTYAGDWCITAHELSSGYNTTTPHKPHDSMMTVTTGSPLEADGSADDANWQPSPTGRTAWFTNKSGDTTLGLAQPPLQLPKAYPALSGVSMTPHHHFQLQHYTSPFTPGWEMDMTPRNVHSPSNATCDPFQAEHMACEPHHVVKWKITKGVDVRTTIMVRNLPNTWTYRDLKNVLDHCSKGKYDFSYLRIDFAQNKNVGYGFVNFVNPCALIEFVDQYGNQFWSIDHIDRNGHPRDAKFSYATIQGLDCLIEKFRNSAIMDEYSDYRPKLWHTKDTAVVPSDLGTERSFPAPNNLSKKQRSVDNASQIGLYASNRKGMSGGGRKRYSQYDRGTTAAEQEDAYYNQVSPTMRGFGYGVPTMGFNPHSMPPAHQQHLSPMVYGSMNGMQPLGGPYVNGAQMVDIHGFPTGAVADAYGGRYNGVGAPAPRFGSMSRGKSNSHPPRSFITWPSANAPVMNPTAESQGMGFEAGGPVTFPGRPGNGRDNAEATTNGYRFNGRF